MVLAFLMVLLTEFLSAPEGSALRDDSSSGSSSRYFWRSNRSDGNSRRGCRGTFMGPMARARSAGVGPAAEGGVVASCATAIHCATTPAVAVPPECAFVRTIVPTIAGRWSTPFGHEGTTNPR